MKQLARLLFLLLIIVPLISWFMVKPIRLVAPQVGELTCAPAFICVDQSGDSEKAHSLYTEAYETIAKQLGNFQKKPRVIFCSSKRCNQYYGLGKRSAVTFGTFGTVIGSNAWRPHYVEHELVHYLQYQNLGYVKVLSLPQWIKEGMAYSLSSDPRAILASPWQQSRAQFGRSFEGVTGAELWQAIAAD